MKLMIEIPSNFVSAYGEILASMNDNVSVEQAIADAAKERVQDTLYNSWELLDENYIFSHTTDYDAKHSWKIARRIIKKHRIPKQK